jgi:hypothetical protein
LEDERGGKRVGIEGRIAMLEQESELAAERFSDGQPLAYLQPEGWSWWDNYEVSHLCAYMPGFNYFEWLSARIRECLGSC